MRHIIWLGLRGLLLEFGGVLLRIHGAQHYRRLLRQRSMVNPLGLHRVTDAPRVA